MPADPLDPTNNFHVSNLLTRWKEITDTLVIRGHTAELYQELDHRSGRVRTAQPTLSPDVTRPQPNLTSFITCPQTQLVPSHNLPHQDIVLAFYH